MIYTLPVNLSNVSGYNETGASVGGFELSSENCIIVGNAVDFTASRAEYYEMRNIFLSITDTQLTKTKVVWLTDYASNELVQVRTPHLVKIEKDSFLVMWEVYFEETEKTYTELLTIDGSGNITSDKVITDMRLSDCAPILCSDGLVRWYATGKSTPVVYTVNPLDLKAVHTHVFDDGTITKEATCKENGITLYTCIGCGETKTEKITKEHYFGKDGKQVCACGYVPFAIATEMQDFYSLEYGYTQELILSVGVTTKAGIQPTYQWYENGRQIKEAKSESYQFPEGQEIGRYTYFCVVSCDGYTKTSSMITVEVTKKESKIQIAEGKEKITVKYGGAAFKLEGISKIGDGNLKYAVIH